MNNQNSQPKPGLCRNDSKRIRAAVSHVVGAIKGKPDPEDFWYDLTRDGAELRNMHLDALVLRTRQALEMAKGQGAGVQAATVHRVEVMFATLCAMAVHGYEVGAPSDLDAALLTLSEETADVVTAAARAAHQPTERNLNALRFEVLESIEVGQRVVDMAACELVGAGR